MRYRNKLLSNRERIEIIDFLTNDSKFFQKVPFSSEEFLKIKKLGSPTLQIGFALQLIYLKNNGISINSYFDRVSEKLISYISNLLKCDSNSIDKYWYTKNTKERHLIEILNFSGYFKFSYTKEMAEELFKIALNFGSFSTQLKEFLIFLKSKKILTPNLSVIEQFLWLSNKEANEKIYESIFRQIPNKERLYSVLNVEKSGTSTYSRIKTLSVNSNSNGIRELLKVVKEIDTFNDPIDVSFLSDSKLSYFLLEIQKSDKSRIEKFSSNKKKYVYLVLFLYFKRKEFIDMIIEVTSTYAGTVLKRSRKKSKLYSLQLQEKLKSNSLKLKEIVNDILNIKNIEELEKYQKELLPLNDELNLEKSELEEIDFLLKSHQSFNYTNELLGSIKFDSHTKPKFIKNLKEFPELKYKKKIQIDTSIFNLQCQKNIKKMDFNKKVVELAFLYTIRDYIRSGDIFVRESKKYNSFDSYLVSENKEITSKEAKEFLEKLKTMLIIPKKLNFDRNITADEKSNFSEKIYSYFPKISMPEILFEVNSWTGVLDDIREKDGGQKIIVATLMANGHNIGFSKMSISSGIDEAVLRRTNEYYFNNEALFKAQKTLVNYHYSLDIVKNWGAGEKSSSDGMRVPISSKTIYADYNTHYENRGGGMYRHISDQYTPFYVQMLEGRDSNHVLDGLLYHNSALEIYEHSTDTAGYTEQMFALTYFLGFNFKPRIKNLDSQQLYGFENIENEGKKFKKINENLILENFKEVGRLIESIHCGKVKASLILNKINSYSRNNGVAKGLKEIGRILKTKYILEYYSSELLRKEVQKMLNKGEAINSVGRLMFFGKNGRLNENTIDKQLEKASCLNILLSSLIIWNSRYLEKIYRLVCEEKWFDKEEFKRISPLGTEHVNFLGKYVFEESVIETKDGLREIKIKA